MFFQDRIQNIATNDEVLEIGPGANPHPRSDAFLELKYEDEAAEQAQFGHTGKLNTTKEIHFYDGREFPFEDNSFDYIICSHVLEHVEDVEFFMKELKRVAPKGYLEYPNIYYDYLFNFDVHLNFLKKDGNDILWMKKSDSNLETFSSFHKDFYKLLDANQFAIFIQNNRNFLFEGYEYDNTIQVKTIKDINALKLDNFNPSAFNVEEYVRKNVSFKTLLKIMMQKFTKRGK